MNFDGKGSVGVEVKFSLKSAFGRWLQILILTLACLMLGRIVTANFIIGVFNDSRTTVTKAELEAASAYYPTSSILQALLSQAEMTEAADHEGTASKAESAAVRAVNLSPWRYDFRLLLASARELNGNRSGTEACLREALRLAPNNVEVHWRMANLLVRENRLTEAFPHFRAAVTANPTLLVSVHDLVWKISGEKFEAVDAVTGDRPQSRLTLAMFLLKQMRIEDAARVFTETDREARLRWNETPAFLQALGAAGHPETYRKLWAELVTGKRESVWPLIWNGGFEEDSRGGLTQFDWAISNSKYVALSFDSGTFHSGARAVRVDFAGLDTTSLDGELRQLVLVEPGKKYRLECFVKTKNFSSPEGPRLAVVDQGTTIATTAAVTDGSKDWQAISTEFICPSGRRLLEVRLQRKPKFSYDDPTRGTIWLDDFSLKELTRP